jgi:hypothetical protein
MSRFLSRTAVCCLLAVASCQAEPPTSRPTEFFEEAEKQEGKERASGELIPFSVADIVRTTRWPSLPCRGTGPAGGEVHYKNTVTGRTDRERIKSDGNWCIPLELAPDQDNRFLIWAYGEKRSKPIQVDVRHESPKAPEAAPPKPSESGEPAAAAEVETVLYSGIHASTNLVVRGEDDVKAALSRLTDGDMEQATRLQQNDLAPIDWLKFELSEPGQIQAVHVRSGFDCPLLEYQIYISNSVFDPGVPGQDPGWQLAFDVNQGAAIASNAFQTPVQTGWVALVILSEGCVLPGFDVRVNELIEVTADMAPVVAEEQTPAEEQRQKEFKKAQGPIAPTCENGGIE